MKALVTLTVLIALTSWIEASSIDGVPPAPAFYAFTLEDAAPASAAHSEAPASPAVPEDLAVGLIMLSAFLALIAGSLLRWSGEPWKVEKVR